MTRRRLGSFIIGPVLVVAGCSNASDAIDGGGIVRGPAAPSPQFPSVAGIYEGPLTLTSSSDPQRIDGSMRMVVGQADAQIKITGSITFLDVTVEVPEVTGTINRTGLVTVTGGTPITGGSGLVEDPDCGWVTTTSSTLVLSGSTARLDETSETEFCGNWTLSGTLPRR